MEREPPLGMASLALTVRFKMTCSTRVGSSRIEPVWGFTDRERGMGLPRREVSMGRMAEMVSARLRGRKGSLRLLRLKARSWRGRLAARSPAWRISEMESRASSLFGLFGGSVWRRMLE